MVVVLILLPSFLHSSIPFPSPPKLDALSLFPYELSVGGGEAAGIVVLLAAAEAIGRLKREVSYCQLQQP